MTRAERLKGLLLKMLPDRADHINGDEWGTDEVDAEGKLVKAGGCPYQFKTLSDGRRQLIVDNRDTGDRIGVVGTTVDELLDKLEARLS